MKRITCLQNVMVLITLSLLSSPLWAAEIGSRQSVAVSESTSQGSHLNFDYHWSDGEYSIQVDASGEIAFTGDDRGVERISPDGHLIIKERGPVKNKKIYVRGNPEGKPEYELYINAIRAPFDEEAQQWFSTVLQKIIRESGLNAEARIRRILQEQGVDGVLNDISQIRSSSAKTKYFTELFEQANLNSGELIRTAHAIADGISSSGDKTRLLTKAASQYVGEPGSHAAYFDAAATIRSSGDLTRLLTKLIENREPQVDAEFLTKIMTAASSIKSSGDRARLLVRATPFYTNQAQLREAFFSATKGIKSSGDKARVLASLIDKGDQLDAKTWAQALETVQLISSSGDKARLLVKTAPQYRNEDTFRQSYFAAVGSIRSSGDQARVLISLIDKARLDQASLSELLRSVRKISSDGDKTRVLVQVAPALQGNDELVALYVEIAETLRSSSGHRRALSALTGKKS